MCPASPDTAAPPHQAFPASSSTQQPPHVLFESPLSTTIINKPHQALYRSIDNSSTHRLLDKTICPCAFQESPTLFRVRNSPPPTGSNIQIARCVASTILRDHLSHFATRYLSHYKQSLSSYQVQTQVSSYSRRVFQLIGAPAHWQHRNIKVIYARSSLQ